MYDFLCGYMFLFTLSICFGVELLIIWELSLIFWGMALLFCGLFRWLSGKESACNTGDSGLIPGLGRYPGGRNGSPLQYSCLENPMDRGAWWAAVHGFTSWIWLSATAGACCFHSSCTILHSQQCIRIPVSLYSYQHLFLSIFFPFVQLKLSWLPCQKLIDHKY